MVSLIKRENPRYNQIFFTNAEDISNFDLSLKNALMTQNENNAAEDLIQFIWNKRKLLILITLIGAIASVIYSLVIQEKYKSVVTVFPAKSTTVAFTDEVHSEQSAATFGEEEEAEQMIQVLQSAEIRNNIIYKYNLMEHYEIDTSSKIKFTALNKT